MEILDKGVRSQPRFRNRIRIAAGVELVQGAGAAPVVQLYCIRCQWRNFGIVVIADYIRHEYYEKAVISRRYVAESFSSGAHSRPLVGLQFRFVFLYKSGGGILRLFFRFPSPVALLCSEQYGLSCNGRMRNSPFHKYALGAGFGS